MSAPAGQAQRQVVINHSRADAPSDEIAMKYISDAAELVPQSKTIRSWKPLAEAKYDDPNLDLEDRIRALDWYAARVQRALKAEGFHTEWTSGGFTIYWEVAS